MTVRNPHHQKSSNWKTPDAKKMIDSLRRELRHTENLEDRQLNYVHNNIPKVSHRVSGSSEQDDGIRISVVEPIHTIEATNEFHNRLFPISASSPNTFPKGSVYTAMYTRYKIRKVKFSYFPLCPTDTTGQIAYSYVNDPTVESSQSLVGIISYDDSHTSGPMSPGSVKCCLDESQEFYIPDGTSFDAQAIRLEAAGYFQFATMGCDLEHVDRVCGELFIEYVIDFYDLKPVSDITASFINNSDQEAGVVGANTVAILETQDVQRQVGQFDHNTDAVDDGDTLLDAFTSVLVGAGEYALDWTIDTLVSLISLDYELPDEKQFWQTDHLPGACVSTVPPKVVFSCDDEKCRCHRIMGGRDINPSAIFSVKDKLGNTLSFVDYVLDELLLFRERTLEKVFKVTQPHHRKISAFYPTPAQSKAGFEDFLRTYPWLRRGETRTTQSDFDEIFPDSKLPTPVSCQVYISGPGKKTNPQYSSSCKFDEGLFDHGQLVAACRKNRAWALCVLPSTVSLCRNRHELELFLSASDTSPYATTNCTYNLTCYDRNGNFVSTVESDTEAVTLGSRTTLAFGVANLRVTEESCRLAPSCHIYDTLHSMVLNGPSGTEQPADNDAASQVDGCTYTVVAKSVDPSTNDFGTA